MAGYQKEIVPSSWSPIVKYSVYNINSEVKEALGANIKAGENNIKKEMRSWQLKHTIIMLWNAVLLINQMSYVRKYWVYY